MYEGVRGVSDACCAKSNKHDDCMQIYTPQFANEMSCIHVAYLCISAAYHLAEHYSNPKMDSSSLAC